MTKSIDLTHTFSDNMPVYPGDPRAALYQIAEFHSDGYNDFKIETGMHVGTHIDAPLHMTADGCYISEINVNSFSANGHLIDARNHNLFPPQLIDLNRIQPGDIVLVFTGFGSKFHRPNYFEEYPEFSQEFARLLVEANVSMVGMDTASPDRFRSARDRFGTKLFRCRRSRSSRAACSARTWRPNSLPGRGRGSRTPSI